MTEENQTSDGEASIDDAARGSEKATTAEASSAAEMTTGVDMASGHVPNMTQGNEAADPTFVEQPEYVSALREDTISILSTIIEDRESVLANPVEIDWGAAEEEANGILDAHATAIAEMGINGLFDLLSVQRGQKFDGARYADILRSMSSAEIAAQARKDATGSREALDIVQRRRALAERIKGSSEMVVRGVLAAAIFGVVDRRTGSEDLIA